MGSDGWWKRVHDALGHAHTCRCGHCDALIGSLERLGEPERWTIIEELGEAEQRGHERGVRENEPSALADDYWMPLSIREALRLVSEECPEHAETLRDWIARGNAAKRTAYEHGVLDERERAVGVLRDFVEMCEAHMDAEPNRWDVGAIYGNGAALLESAQEAIASGTPGDTEGT